MNNLTCIQCKNWKTKGCIECVYCETYKDSDVLNIDTLKFNDFEQTYLTPKQYEKRTKKKLSDNAAVWIKDDEKDLQGWRLDNLNCAIDDQRCFIIVVQTSEPPPEDYVPEVEA